MQSIFNDAQAAKRAPLTPADRQNLLNDYLINNQVLVHQTHWYRSGSDYTQDSSVNFPNLTPEQRHQAYVNTGDGNPGVSLDQISPTQWGSLRTGLIRNGVAPTAVNIAKAWRKVYGE